MVVRPDNGHGVNRSSSLPEPLLRYMPSVQAGVFSQMLLTCIFNQDRGGKGRKSLEGICFSLQKWSKSQGPSTT